MHVGVEPHGGMGTVKCGDGSRVKRLQRGRSLLAPVPVLFPAQAIPRSYRRVVGGSVHSSPGLAVITPVPPETRDRDRVGRGSERDGKAEGSWGAGCRRKEDEALRAADGLSRRGCSVAWARM